MQFHVVYHAQAQHARRHLVSQYDAVNFPLGTTIIYY